MKPRSNEMRQEIVTENEMLIKVMRRRAPTSYKAFVILLWFTGIRRGEALSLKTSDIQLTNDFIAFNVITLKKRSNTGRVRVVYAPLRHQFSKVLLEHIYKMLKIAHHKGKPIRIFPWSPKKAHTVVKYFSKDWYPHLFRHTRAVLLAQQNITPWEHAQWFGWSDINMSLVYFRMAGKYTKNIAEKIWSKEDQES